MRRTLAFLIVACSAAVLAVAVGSEGPQKKTRSGQEGDEARQLVAQYRRQIEALKAENRRTVGRLLVGQTMIVKHLEELETTSDPETAKSFFLVVEQLSDKLSRLKCKSRMILPPGSSLDREGSEQAQDPFERELIGRWLKGQTPRQADAATPEYAERLVSGGGEYQYYQPVWAEKSCLSLCHNQVEPVFDSPSALSRAGGTKPLAEGDLMAIVRVSVPNR